MGCDIHPCIQVWNGPTNDSGDYWEEVQWQGDHHWDEKWKPIPDIPVAPAAFNSRNYSAFSILAGVRQEIDDPWPPIAPDRGLPEGFEEEKMLPDPYYALKYPDDPGSTGPRGLGDHSHTYLTLDELKAYDWDVVRIHVGIISVEEFEQLRAKGTRIPEGWSKGISGPGIHVQTLEEYRGQKSWDSMVRMGIPRLSREPRITHVSYPWRWSAREACPHWPSKVIPWLESLAAGRPLRLVLGFDS